jgi:hypothetical protein
MNDVLLELANQINIPELLCIGLMFLFFYQRLDAKISEVDRRVSAKIDEVDRRLSAKIDEVERKLSAKIDDLGKKTNDIDKRLCRIEGSLSTHGHCLFNQNECVKKVD